jgi:hypothetical protein
VKVKLNPVKSILEGKRVCSWTTRSSRDDEPEDRADGESAGAKSAHAHQLPADDFALLLRRRTLRVSPN